MANTPVEIDCKKVELLAGQGLTVKQIADCLDIGRSTLYNHMGGKAELKDAIKRGRAKGIDTVTNSLFESAKSGNVTAQIFYLKNRQPDKWRDRKDVEYSGHISQTIEHRSVSETDNRIEDLFGNGKDQHPAPPLSH